MAAPLDQFNGYYTTGQLSGRLASSVSPEELAAAGGTPKPAEAMLSPIQRTIDPAADRAQSFLDRPFQQPESREEIAERKRRSSQSLIDSINKTYDDEVARKTEVGKERLAIDNAISVMSGLMGSTDAGRTRKATVDVNEKEIAAVNNQRALELNRLYKDISDSADQEARLQVEDATKNAEAVVARRRDAQTKAVESIKAMAAGGLVDFDSFRTSPQNAKVYQYALDSVGGSDEALRAMFMLNRPKEQLVGTPTRMGNKYVQAYQNPITGKVKYEALDLPVDLGLEYKTFQKLGDNLVAIPEGWDGDTAKLKTIVGQPSTMERLQQQSLQLDIAKKQKELSDQPTVNLSETELRQTRDTLVASEMLRDLGIQYKDLIDKHGFTHTLAGNQEVAGQMRSLRGQMTAAYKDAKKLGTLDTGLLTLMEQILGEEPTSTWNPFRNVTGQRSERLKSQVDSLIQTTDQEIKVAKERLGELPATPTGDVAGQLQPGEILVKDKASGQVGAIPANEFDPSLYERQ